MILHVYEKKEVVKTYECETYQLLYGTFEDFIKLFNVDDLVEFTDEAILRLVLKILPKSLSIIEPLIMDVFDGITSDELRRVPMIDIASSIVLIIKHGVFEMGKEMSEKNLLRL